MSPLVAPSVTAALAGLTAHELGLPAVPASVGDALTIGSAMASVGGTMLGFMLAALAVLASINHTHLVSMMKRTGHYRDLLATLFYGGAFFLACAACGFAVLFGVPAGRGFMTCSLALHAGAMVSLIDIARKFWLVLTNLRSEG